MKLGIIGTGNVGCAIALGAVTRGSAREIVLVNRRAAFRRPFRSPGSLLYDRNLKSHS